MAKAILGFIFVSFLFTGDSITNNVTCIGGTQNRVKNNNNANNRNITSRIGIKNTANKSQTHFIMSKRKAPSSENNPNHDFCDFLTELANYERNVNRNIYKYNAYRKAASSLAAHKTRVTSGKDARKLEGVGEKVAEKIDEYLKTGHLKKLDKIRENGTNDSINLLTRVSGIGPVKAKELVDAGITSLADLKKNSDKLTHHQLIGLKYFEDFEKRIPREEISQIETVIRDSVLEMDPKHLLTVCGSYRRGLPSSGDVDMLITHPDFTSSDKGKAGKAKAAKLLSAIVSLLEDKKLITETISHGDVKFMGACRVGEVTRRLDLRIVPYDQYHCATLYFTGSDMFNKEMRAHALQQGFTLNEYSLRPVGSTGVPGEALPVTSEQDIFEYIDYPYKSPEERSV
ncbi:DNA polymerase beta-like [Homalodisca vitripennis]|uniref:DNA polymerase beta-like n=1 Tax=Homalodisca vitripennis TaxID=197043 RepID=UPI001EEA3448|nr:DNA polymerase beta-like [Homalodisca vitripennis]